MQERREVLRRAGGRKRKIERDAERAKREER
jgi:hypothetical protein